MVALLPVKSKKLEVKKRYFHYLLIHAADKVWIQKRTGKDIWQNLHEPYLLEADQPLDTSELVQHAEYKSLKLPKAKPEYEGSLSQRLTHRIIESRFYSLHIPKAIEMPGEGSWQPISALKKLAFPKTLVSFLEKKLYF